MTSFCFHHFQSKYISISSLLLSVLLSQFTVFHALHIKMRNPPLSATDFAPEIRMGNMTIPANKVFTTVHELSLYDLEQSRENHFLVGLLLHIRAANNEMNVSLNSTSNTFTSRGNSNNIYRTSKRLKSSASYRRMFFFFDLLTHGKCFVIFERDHKDEKKFWTDFYVRAKTRVGDIFLISEPYPIENEITGHLSVVQTDSPFIIIKRPTNMLSYMPGIPDRDTLAGFNVSGRTITVRNINSILN
jgi:hypothetical protein